MKKRLKVLVAGCSEFVTGILTERVMMRNHLIDSANSGREVEKKSKSGNYDLAIVQYCLGYKDNGFKATERLRKKKIPVYIVRVNDKLNKEHLISKGVTGIIEHMHICHGIEEALKTYE